MKQNTLRFLPLLIIFFSVIGVLSWFAKNQKDVKNIKPVTVNPSDLESEDIANEASPTPSTSFFFSNEPTTIPETTEPKEDSTSKEEDTATEEDSSDDTTYITTTTTTRTCTPVYGMADSCEEHTVVDTGAESNLAYGLSAFAYLAGLAAFVKSKKN
jgi:hypothetical protein